jgi:hypothetical protein
MGLRPIQAQNSVRAATVREWQRQGRCYGIRHANWVPALLACVWFFNGVVRSLTGRYAPYAPRSRCLIVANLPRTT